MCDDPYPDDSACDDGLWCNGQEVCDPELGCLPGTPPDCSPYECDETSDQCLSTCYNSGDPCSVNGECCSGNCNVYNLCE